MKKQESTISSNKNRGLKYALCIITLLCCILSTVVQATEEQFIEHEYDTRQIDKIRLYGFDSNYNEEKWRPYSITRDSNNCIHTTSYILYGQKGNLVILNFEAINIKQIDYDFYIYAKNSKLSDFTRGIYVSSTSTNNQKGIPTVIKTGNTKTIENEEYTEYRIYGSHKFNPVEVRSILIQTNIEFVSSKIYYDNFTVIVNNEILYTIGEWKDKQQELEQAIQDAEVTINQNDLDNVINSPPTIDNEIKIGIFDFTNSTIPLYIMSMTLSLAIISYLLYGKK